MKLGQNQKKDKKKSRTSSRLGQVQCVLRQLGLLGNEGLVNRLRLLVQAVQVDDQLAVGILGQLVHKDNATSQPDQKKWEGNDD